MSLQTFSRIVTREMSDEKKLHRFEKYLEGGDFLSQLIKLLSLS